MVRERIDDWMQMAKDLAHAERELQIEHWVYITFEYREDDRSRVVLHKIDMPRRMFDRWQWLVEWRRAKYVCQYPRKGVQVYLLLLLRQADGTANRVRLPALVRGSGESADYENRA